MANFYLLLILIQVSSSSWQPASWSENYVDSSKGYENDPSSHGGIYPDGGESSHILPASALPVIFPAPADPHDNTGEYASYQSHTGTYPDSRGVQSHTGTYPETRAVQSHSGTYPDSRGVGSYTDSRSTGQHDLVSNPVVFSETAGFSNSRDLSSELNNGYTELDVQDALMTLLHDSLIVDGQQKRLSHVRSREGAQRYPYYENGPDKHDPGITMSGENRQRSNERKGVYGDRVGSSDEQVIQMRNEISDLSGLVKQLLMTNHSVEAKSGYSKPEPKYSKQEPKYSDRKSEYNERESEYNELEPEYSVYSDEMPYVDEGSSPYSSHGDDMSTPYTPLEPKQLNKLSKLRKMQLEDKKLAEKIISIQRGVSVPGGRKIHGVFKDLKACMKACAERPICFAADYNRWSRLCFMHQSGSACSSPVPHPQVIHFTKVPCSSAEIGASNSAIFPELHLDGATKITGVKSLRGCLKKCIKTENGIAATIADLITTATAPATNLPYRCFGIEYDFITHTCFIHTTFTIQIQIGTPDITIGGTGGIVCTSPNPIATAVDFDNVVVVSPPVMPTSAVSQSGNVLIVICPPA